MDANLSSQVFRESEQTLTHGLAIRRGTSKYLCLIGKAGNRDYSLQLRKGLSDRLPFRYSTSDSYFKVRKNCSAKTHLHNTVQPHTDGILGPRPRHQAATLVPSYFLHRVYIGLYYLPQLVSICGTERRLSFFIGKLSDNTSSFSWLFWILGRAH